MFETIKAKNEAVDFYQLIQVCSGKQIKGFELIDCEVKNNFLEVVTLKRKELFYKVYITKDLDGNLANASLNSYLEIDGQKCKVNNYKEIDMETEEYGDLVVILKSSKNNFNSSQTIEVRLDKNGKVVNTTVEKKDILICPNRTGVGQDIIGRILRKVDGRKIASKADTMKKSMLM